jgi:polysaccharide export outer membrane protein
MAPINSLQIVLLAGGLAAACALAQPPAQPLPSAPPAADATAAPTQSEAPKDLPPPAAVPDDYQIGASDVLQISVWKEPDVSVPTVVVRPDGVITVPLLKDIQVGGRTPRQVEKTIVEGLGKFLNAPLVTVVVTASNSKKVYIIGAVKKEGPLQYGYRMTVMQALSEAGGLTDAARRNRIYIIRTENAADYRLDFNYDEVIKGKRMEQNIVLLPGDTVVIPE